MPTYWDSFISAYPDCENWPVDLLLEIFWIYSAGSYKSEMESKIEKARATASNSAMPKCAGCGNPVGIFVKRATGETEAYHHKCADRLGTLSA